MAGVTASITSPDLEKQVELLNPVTVDRIVNKRAFPAMKSSVQNMHIGFRDVAAVDTGFYRDTLKMEMKWMASRTILHGAVRTFAKSGGGFPYPRALEDSVRYHYRSTRRQGQRTAGQVAKMFLNRMPLYKKLFNSAARLITNDLAVK